MKKFMNLLICLLLTLSIVVSQITVFSINASAAVIDETETGASNPNVLSAQRWLNSTYAGVEGFTPIDVDGVSYSTTFITLVMGFQIELGLSSNNITGTFGPLTKSLCPTFEKNLSNNSNMVKILQYALLCKGYYDTVVNGVFDDNTVSQIVNLQQDAGLNNDQISQKATPTVIQAALSTEIYMLGEGGNTRVREVQRRLNQEYFAYIGIQPCDGIFGANTVNSLITALQANEGLPRREDVLSDDDIYANGNFGNTTKIHCPSIPYDNSVKKYNGVSYSTGEITQFTKLVQYCLCCLKPDKYDPGTFNGTLDNATVNALKTFQNDVALEETGSVSINEWMSLLVSTGNPERNGQAIDSSTRITKEKAIALKNAGYTTVGRYLTGDLVIGGTRVAKNLLRSEMKDIFDAGLNLFVIFQDPREAFSQYPNIETYEELCRVYFTKSRGRNDAEKAFSVANSLGVPHGETIFFTVDYDFLKGEVNESIIPYFTGINDYANLNGNEYKIGIYSARNTCAIVSNAGLTEYSFVSDMSTGYSGNKGYALPDNWVFDQIQEIDNFSSTDGSFAIDKNIISGRYLGFNFFESDNDNKWDYISESSGVSVLVPKNSNAGSIPVFWAKTYDRILGKYKAQYPMFDNIAPNSFVVIKNNRIIKEKSESSLFPFTDEDKIRYVYFRDKGGNINAGYIDSSLLNNYTVWDFEDCNIYRDSEGNSEVYPIVCDDNNDFKLDQPLKYYDINSNYVSTLPKNSFVRIPSGALTSEDYPNLIQIVAVKKPNEDWQEFAGFIDMNFELGNLPSDRALISEDTIQKPEKAPKQKKAVYVLPGFMGSKLYDIDDLTSEIWPDGVTSDVIRSVFITPKLYQAKNNELKVDVNSELDLYGALDTYKFLINDLKSYLSAEYDIVFFPYNWLGDINECALKLEQDINNKGYDSVSFVTHSTGGLLVTAYISNTLNEKSKIQHSMIDKVVMIAPPLYGTYASLQAIETGQTTFTESMLDSYEVPNIFRSTVYGYFQEVLHNSPTAYQLFPSNEYLSQIPAKYFIRGQEDNIIPIVKTDDFYSILNGSLNINSNLTNEEKNSHKYFRETVLMDDAISILQTVDTTIIGSDYCSTDQLSETVTYERCDEVFCRYYDIDLSFNGDGVVSKISSNPSSLLDYINFEGVNHTDLVSYPDVLNTIKSIIIPETSNNNFNNAKLKQSAINGTDIVDLSDYIKINIRSTNYLNIDVIDNSEQIVADVVDNYPKGFTGNLYCSSLNSDDENANIVMYLPKHGYKIVFNKGDSCEENSIDLDLSISLLSSTGLKEKTASYSIINVASLSIDMLNLTVVENNLTSLVTSEALLETKDYSNEWDIEDSIILPNIGDSKSISLNGNDVINNYISSTSLNWFSSNPDIVEISTNGTVTSKDYGKAYIYATDKDGGNKIEKCEVTVPLEATQVDIQDITIILGDKRIIEPVFNSEKVTETHLDFSYDIGSNIISIDSNGVVYGINEGVVEVTATAPGGAYTRFKVTVLSDEYVYANGISLTNVYEAIDSINETVTFSAAVLPYNSVVQNVHWKISDADVAVIEDFSDTSCTIKSVGFGTATLTAYIDDDIYSTATVEVIRPTNVKVHYHNSKNWDTPYIYYQKHDSLSEWQIAPMRSEGFGWFYFEIDECEKIFSTFSDNTSLHVQDENIELYSISGEKWILKGEVTNVKPSGIKVNYYCVNNWEDPHIYYYNDDDHELDFPGVSMCPDGGNNWYTYTIYGLDNPRVIFNNNKSTYYAGSSGLQQHPGYNQPGIQITEDEMWIVNETAYVEKPQGITVHFYRPYNWIEPWNVRIYFYEDDNILMDWPGTKMNNPNDNWMTYTIYGLDNPKVIFNNSRGSQIPGALLEGYVVTQDIWYKNGRWTTYNPE